MARIDGLDRLNRNLRRISPSKGAVERIVRKWSEYVRGEAVDRAPAVTGALQQSIRTDTAWERDTCIGIIYTNLEYAPYVEFGTGRRGAASPVIAPPGMHLAYSDYWEGQAAQPYLYPSLHNNKARILRGMRDDFKSITRGGTV